MAPKPCLSHYPHPLSLPVGRAGGTGIRGPALASVSSLGRAEQGLGTCLGVGGCCQAPALGCPRPPNPCSLPPPGIGSRILPPMLAAPRPPDMSPSPSSETLLGASFRKASQTPSLSGSAGLAGPPRARTASHPAAQEPTESSTGKLLGQLILAHSTGHPAPGTRHPARWEIPQQGPLQLLLGSGLGEERS